MLLAVFYYRPSKNSEAQCPPSPSLFLLLLKQLFGSRQPSKDIRCRQRPGPSLWPLCSLLKSLTLP